LKKQDFENALRCHFKSIEIREKNNLTNFLQTNYGELAEIYLKQNNITEALRYATLVEKRAIKSNQILKQLEANLILSKIYEQMGEHKQALEKYRKYHQIYDEVLGQENSRKIKQLSMHHEMETVQKEKEIFELRNVVLKEALDEIGASVRYAKRIQEAILPPVSLIQSKFPDSYVLYKPKDVVAGDFYWMEEVDDTIFIAAADCTGHGVPGAMVSVVCYNALNRALKGFQLKETGKILDKVSDLVCEAFERSSEEVKDGMDISLLSINKVTNQINWSGANNPLWYFNNSGFNEIIANKRPIGKSDNKKPFTTHTIQLQPDTTFILFTDGYADQFGGEKGKKMMYKRFKESLETTLCKGFKQQQNELEEIFLKWKGDLEQVDDVCVIGIKLE
jgi:serine phosphatase RsbU (regulator of sigma subunit)